MGKVSYCQNMINTIFSQGNENHLSLAQSCYTSSKQFLFLFDYLFGPIQFQIYFIDPKGKLNWLMDAIYQWKEEWDSFCCWGHFQMTFIYLFLIKFRM